MSESVGLVKRNTTDNFPLPMSEPGNLRDSLFQRSNPGVNMGFGSAPLIFILVLICLILLLSILVTLLCCLKEQISDNNQTANSNKTCASRGIQTKPTPTEKAKPAKKVIIIFQSMQVYSRFCALQHQHGTLQNCWILTMSDNSSKYFEEGEKLANTNGSNHSIVTGVKFFIFFFD